jgi:hypothetical protein
VVSHSALASGRLSGSDLGLRARVLGYQFVPFLSFTNPECVILIFKRRALAAESGHGMAISKHIHSTFPSRSNAKRYARNVPVLLQTLSTALRKNTDGIIALIHTPQGDVTP